VGVAVFVPWRQQRNAIAREERRRRLEARALAVAVYPDLLEPRARINAAYRIVTEQLAPGPSVDVRKRLDTARLETLPILCSSLDRLYLITENDAGASIIQLIFSVEQYERLRQEEAGRLRLGEMVVQAEIKNISRRLGAYLALLRGRVEQAVGAIP